jgi:hypothetical protein
MAGDRGFRKRGLRASWRESVHPADRSPPENNRFGNDFINNIAVDFAEI